MTWNQRLQRLKEALPWRRSRGDSVPVSDGTGEVESVDAGPLLTPSMSVYEGESDFIVEVDVPGASSEQAEVTHDGNVLSLTAPTRALPGGRMLGWPEYWPATWHRRLQLPESADLAAAKANVREGVLTIRIPKRGQSAPRRIEVKTA